MNFLRFLRRLADSFFRWWWAALTGVASVLSWFGVPEGGQMLSRTVVAASVFFILMLLFLVSTISFQSYEWYVQSNVHPTVLRVAHAEGGKLIFVVRSIGRPLTPGHLLAVHRDVAGAEVCMAILRFDRARQDGDGDQCDALWISPGHQRDLAQGKIACDALHLRRDIPADAIDRLPRTQS